MSTTKKSALSGKAVEAVELVQTVRIAINSKHSALMNLKGVTVVDDILCIPGGYGLQSVFVSMEHCFSNMQTTGDASSCGHRVRYADGRLLLLSCESIRKMFISRHQRVHTHFRCEVPKN